MDYVIKFGVSYVSVDGTLTTKQTQAVRVDGAAKPFCTPDAGYRFVRIRPANEVMDESEALQS